MADPEKPSGTSNGTSNAPPAKQGWSTTKKVVVGVIVVLVLGIGLGVGLGVGLTRGDNGSDQAETHPGQPQIESLRAEHRLPALAVGESNGTDFTMTVAGVRRYNTTEPLATVDDAWHLGSITKSMTALLIASFVREGAFAWDTTISEAIPDIASEIHPDYANVTLAMLTSHHSGLNSIALQTNITYFLSLYKISDPVEARRRFVVDAFSEPPAAAPNSSYFYDNLNYVMAGLILDLTTESPWETHIQTRLFDALNMTGCGIGSLPETNDTSIDSPWPHTVDANGNPLPQGGGPRDERDFPPAYGPAGTAHCPMDGLRKYLQLHVDGAFGLEPRWHNLTAEDFEFLHATWQPGDAGGNYTPGGLVHPRERSWWHNGSNNLNSAYFWLSIGASPEESRFIMAMTNIGGDAAMEAIIAAATSVENGEIDLFGES